MLAVTDWLFRTQSTDGGALSAQGGGEAAFLRASTAAFANVESNDVNYTYLDQEALRDAINDHCALDPSDTEYDASFREACGDFLGEADGMDTNSDGFLNGSEFITLVQDIFADGSKESFTSAATILDIMNNMPSVQVEDFDDTLCESAEDEEDDICLCA